jgi:hypothetical protein
MSKFNCNACKYSTNFRADFNKHILTKKHNKTLVVEEIYDNKCEYCGIQFKHASSLSKHTIHRCKIKKENDVVVYLESKISAQQKQIDTTHTINVINNTQNNTQNNIKINSYRDTDYSHLTDATFIHALTKGLMCGNEIIKQVHFNKDLPENRNILLTNLRGKFIKIMQNNKWTVVDRRSHLETLLETAGDLLTDWLETADRQHKDRHETISGRAEHQNEYILNTFKLMLYNLCA